MAPAWLARNDAAALDAFVRKVREALGPRLLAIKLFGSKARGVGGPESDIDVLVVAAGADFALEQQVIDLAFDVNLAHDVYISPRVLSPEVLANPVWRETAFVRALQAEGVNL
jgi:predicted nucleotidyltransferase